MDHAYSLLDALLLAELEAARNRALMPLQGQGPAIRQQQATAPPKTPDAAAEERADRADPTAAHAP